MEECGIRTAGRQDYARIKSDRIEAYPTLYLVRPHLCFAYDGMGVCNTAPARSTNHHWIEKSLSDNTHISGVQKDWSCIFGKIAD